ncbi:Acyl-CoA N-acyltransferase [Penicillium angulare]|uniref:Acyl-CoA N-acyltransferase n=1 Tax=Penicillium angulare TaxID=116970 RepID=UPI002540FEA5|nr:Acyl-CoA N-acyltransferase [Penicillium angulare]KAJ5290970.1 Acyl-CoA N-acyltransferase [Penicillium angulare]
MSKISVFPFPTRELANERIKLVPFNPDHHGGTFFRHITPALFENMSIGPWKSISEFKSAFHNGPDRHILSFDNPESFAFAIIDKTRPPSSDDIDGELAGAISYINTSATNLCTEIGFVVVLPPYQRSHVAINAAGLMVQNVFESPDNGGLGLCRAHWKASTDNPASSRLAEKVGFEKIGVTKWHMRFPKGAIKGKIGNGRGLPPGSDPEDVWRDSVELTLSWEDWQNGAAEKAKIAMAR